jgi:hypothetical protein
MINTGYMLQQVSDPGLVSACGTRSFDSCSTLACFTSTNAQSLANMIPKKAPYAFNGDDPFDEIKIPINSFNRQERALPSLSCNVR